MATMQRLARDGLVTQRISDANNGGPPMTTQAHIPMTTTTLGKTIISSPSDIKMPPKPATVENDDDPVTEPPAAIVVSGDGDISNKTPGGSSGGVVNLSKKPTIKRNISSSAADSGCSYRDYSRVPANETSNVASIFKAASAKEPTFPVKLHMILSNPDFEDIVSWMPHGRSWRILKPELFEDRVLPQFFCHCRLSSFMRQVNGWGFRRIKHGPDYNSYYNELFLRGLPHLAERMRRESVSARSKQSQTAQASANKKGTSEDEPTPDLYKISEENPVPENPTKLGGKANGNLEAPGPDQVVSSSSSAGGLMGLPKAPTTGVPGGAGAAGLAGLYGQAPLGATSAAAAGQFGALGGMNPAGAGGILGSGLTPSEEAAFLAGAAASRNAAAGGAAMSQQQVDMVNAFRASRLMEEQRRLAAMDRLDEMNRLTGGRGGSNLFNEQQQAALLREQQMASMLRAGAGDDNAELRRMVLAEQEMAARQQQQALMAQAGMGLVNPMMPQAAAAASRLGAAPGMDYGSLAAFPGMGGGMNMNMNMNMNSVGLQDYERLARAAQAQQQQPAMQQQQQQQPDQQVTSTASGDVDISSLPILHRPSQV